jgi:hypothetical protein
MERKGLGLLAFYIKPGLIAQKPIWSYNLVSVKYKDLDHVLYTTYLSNHYYLYIERYLVQIYCSIYLSIYIYIYNDLADLLL